MSDTLETKKPIRGVVKFPVWEYEFRISIVEDLAHEASLHKMLRGQGIGNEEAVTVSIANRPISYILFRSGRLYTGVLAHEAWHGVSRMLRYNGASLDEETVAYHLGYLVDEISRIYKKGK